MAPRIKSAYCSSGRRTLVYCNDNGINDDLEEGHAGVSEMARLISHASDEKNRKECTNHVDVNEEKSETIATGFCSRSKWESCLGYVFFTAWVICAFFYFYTVYDRVPPAARISGAVVVAIGYCNYIFWMCRIDMRPIKKIETL
jgi:hypothetical protein